MYKNITLNFIKFVNYFLTTKNFFLLFFTALISVLISYNASVFYKHILKYMFLFLLVYLLFSMFLTLNKTYRYSKYTSQTQRFWKRSFILFWIIEFYLFFIFIFLVFSHFSESTYFLDWTILAITNFNSINFFIFNNFVILVLLLLLYLLIFLKKFNNAIIINTILYIAFIVFLTLLTDEFSKLFYAINYYKETNMSLTYFFSKEKINFSFFSEIEILNKTRTLHHYIFLFTILKFWHVFFIVIYYIFFFLKKCEDNNLSYDAISSNITNVLYLYFFNTLTFMFFVKFFIALQFKNTYYWFFINLNYMDFFSNTILAFSFDFFLMCLNH